MIPQLEQQKKRKKENPGKEGRKKRTLGSQIFPSLSLNSSISFSSILHSSFNSVSFPLTDRMAALRSAMVPLSVSICVDLAPPRHDYINMQRLKTTKGEGTYMKSTTPITYSSNSRTSCTLISNSRFSDPPPPEHPKLPFLLPKHSLHTPLRSP
jgi:hypothetical protein